MRGHAIAAGVLALMVASSACAGASEDGAAGLQALNNGAYDQAIRHFTRALNSGELAPDEEELAYYSRAEAYFNKNDYGHSIADLKAAIRLKPDNQDAQAALQTAVAKLVDLSDVQAEATAGNRPSFLGALGQAVVAGAVAGIQQGIQNSVQGQNQ